jgi:putative membrane protein
VTWIADPLLVATVLMAIAAVYVRGVAVVWRRGGLGAVVGPWRVAAFLAGCGALAFALLSPLDALGHVLFSAHMVQHVVLMFVVAPLLVAGAPLLPFLWSLPRRWRLATGQGWNARPRLRRAWHALTGPLVVWVITATTLWVWHLPGPYQAAVVYPFVHALEHATMLGSSLLFWWVVLQPVGRRRIDGGTAVLLVFATKVQGGTLGALITFAPNPVYPLYEASVAAWAASAGPAAGPLAGLTPLQDQHLAGLIMGTVGGLVYLAAGSVLFLSWLRSIERRGRPVGVGAAPAAQAPHLDLGARSR